MAARQERDLVRLEGQRLDQRANDRCHCMFVTVLKRAYIIGRGNIDNFGIRQFRLALAYGDDVSVHIVALGFGETRGANGNDLWCSTFADVEQCGFDVVVAAQNGGCLLYTSALNLPEDKYSQGLRCKIAHQVATGSFDEAVEAIDRDTGTEVAKRLSLIHI